MKDRRVSDTIRDRADRVIDGARQRAQALMEFLQQKTGTRKLEPQPVPVRKDR